MNIDYGDKNTNLSPTQRKQTHKCATILFTLWPRPGGSCHSKDVKYRIHNISRDVQEAGVPQVHEESVSHV